MSIGDKPHVIIIMADQLRYDALGAHTPNINALMEDSYSFSRGYCTSPLCVPARGSFFTGLYPNETGSIINPWEAADAVHGEVQEGIGNLYELMQGHWDSRHCGKQHFYTREKLESRPDSPTKWTTIGAHYQEHLRARGHRKPGGERFRGMVPEMALGRVTRMKRYSVPATGCYEPGFDSFFDGFIANSAVDAIRQRDESKPLLLNAMFVAPHPPYDVPEPWFSSIGEVDLPENVGEWYPDQSPLQLYNLTGAIGTRYTREDWAAVWPVYVGLVGLLDHCVGMIVGELRKHGLYDEALIVFTSDHGEMLGSHCLYQKMCMYEESVRTPLAFKLPRSKEFAGSGNSPPTGHSDVTVSAVDVFPTVCQIAGLAPPTEVSGRSLVPVMLGQGLEREQVFIQFDGNGARGNFQRAVLRGRRKLIVDIFKDEYFLELYDTIDDPSETTNLAFGNEHRGLLEELIEILREHMGRTGDLLSLPADLGDRFLRDYTPFRPSTSRGRA